jgi:putative PIN family toxin of toxin-antitoxin system
MQLVVAGELLPCVSSSTLLEYREVLYRSKFNHIPQVSISSALAALSRGRIVEPRFTLSVSPDEKDNRFLECAHASNAHFLVTGNKRHYPEEWLNTRIVNARELLEALYSGTTRG